MLYNSTNKYTVEIFTFISNSKFTQNFITNAIEMMKINTTMPDKSVKNNSVICILSKQFLSNQPVRFVYKNLENKNLGNYRLRRA